MDLSYNTTKLVIDNLKNIITTKYKSLTKDNIKAFYFKQFKNADLISINKNISSSGKTSHIACTGAARTFFYEAYGNAILNDYRKEDLTRTIPIFVESKYTNSSSTTNDFVKSNCAIWGFPKKEGNQFGLSKLNLDSLEFRMLREHIYENDVLIFFKYISNEKEINIYTLLLKAKSDIKDIETLKINTRSQYWEDISNDTIISDTDIDFDLKNDNTNLNEINPNTQIIGINKIFLGAPGTGKSNFVHNNYYVKKNAKRITFHPEYTYHDFVGSIKPCISANNVLTYEFIPGIFTEIITEAFNSPNTEFNLIIEELNRANTSAVFGDLFQLLDRKSDGTSEYPIFNREIINYINNNSSANINELIIPNNLNLIATMNSSDQNIFTMDTAFKRRWDFEYIPVIFNDQHPFKDLIIPGLAISWEVFATIINEFMLSQVNADLIISEDKQLGPYFIKKDDLNDISKFSYKVFLYLWDDVFKMDRYRIFNIELRSFSQLIKLYKTNPQAIFSELFIDFTKKYFQNEEN